MPDLIFNKLANWRANVFQTNIIINQWDFSNTMYCKSLISLFIIFFILKFFISSRNFLNTTWISVSYEKNREVIIRSLQIYVDVFLHSLTYKSLPFYVLLTKYFLYFWTFSLNCSGRQGVISGLHFPVFGLNTEIYLVNLHIQSEYRKIRTRNNSVFGHFSRSGK